MSQKVYAHPHVVQIPDPNDRTPNDPAVLVDSKHVKAFARHQFSSVELESSSEQELYCDAARKKGWEATAIGASVLLRAYPKLIDNNESNTPLAPGGVVRGHVETLLVPDVWGHKDLVMHLGVHFYRPNVPIDVLSTSSICEPGDTIDTNKPIYMTGLLYGGVGFKNFTAFRCKLMPDKVTRGRTLSATLEYNDGFKAFQATVALDVQIGHVTLQTDGAAASKIVGYQLEVHRKPRQ